MVFFSKQDTRKDVKLHKYLNRNPKINRPERRFITDEALEVLHIYSVTYKN